MIEIHYENLILLFEYNDHMFEKLMEEDVREQMH